VITLSKDKDDKDGLQPNMPSLLLTKSSTTLDCETVRIELQAVAREEAGVLRLIDKGLKRLKKMEL
jgi:hypothetical protein